MKLLVSLLLTFSTVVLGQSSADESDSLQHVVLVSIDGLRPEFYLDDRYPLPTLRILKEQGAHAKGVRGVYPTVTYPSHTTMVTGATPAQHGIYYNEVFNRKGDSRRW
ncbi:MAG: alkaline phosphatase family protein, partial [Bacteroidota bacterium]